MLFILSTDFREVLQLSHIHKIAAIQHDNIFLVWHETLITAYSLELLGQVALRMSSSQLLDANKKVVTHPLDRCQFMEVAKFKSQDTRKFCHIRSQKMPSTDQGTIKSCTQHRESSSCIYTSLCQSFLGRGAIQKRQHPSRLQAWGWK